MDEEGAAKNVRFLDGSKVRVMMHQTRRTPCLTIEGDRSYIDVHFTRAYPFSAASKYVAAFDGEEREIGLIRDLADLPPEDRAVVERDLSRRYFTPTISRIHGLRQDATLWLFDVESSRGRCQFYVRHWRDSAHELAPGRWMITSVDGVRFEIPDWNALDERSKVLLEQLS
jgi:hypothetical protein